MAHPQNRTSFPAVWLSGFALAALLATGCSEPATHLTCTGPGCNVVCSAVGETCLGNADCCPGSVCNAGTCGCALIGSSCAGGTQCCGGLSCTSDTCCGDPGAACTDDGQCCSGFSCDGGVCACLPEGASCSAEGEPCCSGTSCDPTGHCRAACSSGTCQPFGAACTGNSDCCAPGTCNGGQCGDPSTAPGCSYEGQACATAADCCGSVALGSRPDCVAASDGGNICHFANVGEACDDLRHCIPGTTCIVPVADAGTSDGGPGLDGGPVPDGGPTPDGGPEPDGGPSPDAGSDGGQPVDGGPVGTCRLPSTGSACTLYTANCASGDSCDPSSSTNQGYDPCYIKVSGMNLAYRSSFLVCHANVCTLPLEGEGCTGGCIQTAGDSRATRCLDLYDGSKQCMPSCTRDSDCKYAQTYDFGSAAQPLTNYCVNYGGGGGCGPSLCFIEGQSGFDDPAVLYKPCNGDPNSLCLPRYDGNASQVLGFCMATRPNAGTTSTVGQACYRFAGTEATDATCGPDAVCMGGRCAQVCDEAQAGANSAPTCPSDLTCISPQGLDLVADWQFGGCADPCDPFADEFHSGCANYCGGPKARCYWIINDGQPGQPRGYCGAALQTPLADGQPCTRDAIDPCGPGSYCLYDNTTNQRYCTRLCNPSVDAGTPSNDCPPGKTCTSFGSTYPHSGYCQ